MSEAPPPNPAYTKDELRYLCRSFLWIFITLMVINAVVCWLFVTTFLSQSFTRTGDHFDHWPTVTLKSLTWPAPQHIAFYSGNDLVTSIYAVAWDDERTKYEMEVTRIGYPLSTAEVIDTRISNRKTDTTPTPPLGSSPSRRLHPLGVIINPAIYAFSVWIFIGFLPVSTKSGIRRKQLKSWKALELCGHCQYDIQDLPICPECGNPTHKPQYAKDQST